MPDRIPTRSTPPKPNWFFQSPEAIVPEASSNTATAIAVEPTSSLLQSPPRPVNGIMGRRGRYQLGQLLKEEDWMRLYEGMQMPDGQPVLIKEYFLSERLDSTELKQRKVKFEQLTKISFSSNNKPEFRVITPLDTDISSQDYRCYVVTEAIANSTTLEGYLEHVGAMPANFVRQLFKQVLQTLLFLHSQKVRFATGEVKQPYGNLKLDNVLFALQDSPVGVSDPQFFIYIILETWEDLFQSETQSPSRASIVEDLKALGYIGFSLLTGTAIAPNSGQSLDSRLLPPELKQPWDAVSDRSLKQFIYQLVGLSRPIFTSAAAAREALLKAPKLLSADSALAIAEADEEVEEDDSEFVIRQPLTALLLGILFGMISSGGMWLFGIGRSTIEEMTISKLSDVQVSDEPMNYVYVQGSSWSNVLDQTGLVAEGEELIEQIAVRQAGSNPPKLNIFKSSVSSHEGAIAQLQAGDVDFILTTTIEKIPADLALEPVAYDGVAVFVAFNDPAQGQNISSQLDGDLSFDELREIYVDRNWHPPDSLETWQVEPYVPFADQNQAIKLFQQIVLKGGQLQESPEVVRQQQHDEFHNENFTNHERTASIFGAILKGTQDEKQELGIGFGLFSSLSGQCAVYPLAIGERQKVQALIQDKNQPIQPTTDLCSKGRYHPNIEAFALGYYPLAFKLVVVYRQESSTGAENFIKLLKTDEGQCLLSEAGLVPLQPCTQP
ncbi:hypothetical protein H6F93_02810 [Leptolyngbya sp. FACHB-671]|nr:hypothetical protein [Leptolyngbya sp. FACHB-671]